MWIYDAHDEELPQEEDLTMPFRSKQQQKFAFATDQPWAKKWAHETGEHHGKKGSKAVYASLPKKVKPTKKKKGK